jgi:hypothetical protein
MSVTMATTLRSPRLTSYSWRSHREDRGRDDKLLVGAPGDEALRQARSGSRGRRCEGRRQAPAAEEVRPLRAVVTRLTLNIGWCHGVGSSAIAANIETRSRRC